MTTATAALKELKAEGYNVTRTTRHDYTHVVIFRNREMDGFGGTWHTSAALAEISAKKLCKKSWLEVVAIVEVEKTDRFGQAL